MSAKAPSDKSRSKVASAKSSERKLSGIFTATTTNRDPTSKSADEEQTQQLESLLCYHRRLHRSDTVLILHHPGDFLLRKGLSKDRFVVSVYWQSLVLHFPIRTLAAGYTFEAMAFPSVEQLIAWHRRHKVPVTRVTGAILLTNQLIPIRRLTRGHFGDVCMGKVALRDGTVKLVAIKTMHTGAREGKASETEVREEEVLREARILREMGDHQNVAKYYGSTCDSISGHTMTAMELVLGGRLDERLKSKSKLTPTTKRFVVMSAAKALLHVRCHGYVHRDVSTKNFLVDS